MSLNPEDTHGRQMWLCPCLGGQAVIFAAIAGDTLGQQTCPMCHTPVAASDAYPMWLSMVNPNDPNENTDHFQAEAQARLENRIAQEGEKLIDEVEQFLRSVS